jgi:integrase
MLLAKQVEVLAAKPGKHAIGESLYLTVSDGSKRWTFIFRHRRPGQPAPGKRYEMGLGSLDNVTLKQARAAVAVARAQLLGGVNPIEARKHASGAQTFGDAATKLIEVRSKDMRNEKAKYRIKRALEVHAKDLWSLSVNDVRTDDVIKVLTPIWAKTPEAAGKVRGYIEAVLDAAKAAGHRSGDNPARWHGHLDHLMPKRAKLTRGHHAALPFADIPAFIHALRARDALSAKALEFTILTASRSGEVFGAPWSEFNLNDKVWIIPAKRMKGGLEHRVPLSGRAVEILTEVAPLRGGKDGDYVFPGKSSDKPLSSMAFAMLLRRMGRGDLTTHGFRSSFRDWCGEATNFPREVAEAALAHAVGDDVELAYRRGDALAKRRKLMDAWANYAGKGIGGEGNVLAFSRTQKSTERKESAAAVAAMPDAAKPRKSN